MDGLAISPAARLLNEPTNGRTHGRWLDLKMRPQGSQGERLHSCAATVSVSLDATVGSHVERAKARFLEAFIMIS